MEKGSVIVKHLYVTEQDAEFKVCSQGEEGEGQEKHNRKELKKMIYLYQQTEKGE